MSNQQPILGWLSIMKKTEFVDYEIEWTYDLLTISGCFCLIVIIRQRYIHDGIELIFFFCLHVRTYLSIYSYSIKKVQLPIIKHKLQLLLEYVFSTFTVPFSSYFQYIIL